eukprot:scaffold450858_cov19-Prasinocladus_malaysianus.AAC.1
MGSKALHSLRYDLSICQLCDVRYNIGLTYLIFCQQDTIEAFISHGLTQHSRGQSRWISLDVNLFRNY